MPAQRAWIVRPELPRLGLLVRPDQGLEQPALRLAIATATDAVSPTSEPVAAATVAAPSEPVAAAATATIATAALTSVALTATALALAATALAAASVAFTAALPQLHQRRRSVDGKQRQDVRKLAVDDCESLQLDRIVA